MKGLKTEDLNNCLHLLDNQKSNLLKVSRQQLMTSLPMHCLAKPMRKEPATSGLNKDAQFNRWPQENRPTDSVQGLWNSPAPAPPNFALSSLCLTDREFSHLILLCPLPVTHPCMRERCPHVFSAASLPVFWGDADIKFHVPLSTERPPSHRTYT
jgi:hypothetical protein